jgi:hypothetical protein
MISFSVLIVGALVIVGLLVAIGVIAVIASGSGRRERE